MKATDELLVKYQNDRYGDFFIHRDSVLDEVFKFMDKNMTAHPRYKEADIKAQNKIPEYLKKSLDFQNRISFP
ncbi:MAG: hypothetical protein CO093_00710 [Alphaproteobacteria bacterium CG_4_9_14_3_um_filter_47_13]|nr:MAG: hypothetical protein CO093_00710 [Alphaproteobacteria bacterium CG_4_9_14_3_um_filter_47_13]